MAGGSPCGSPARSCRSPTSPKHTADSAVALQLQQFFDDWLYRIMNSSMGKQWTRNKALYCALELFALNGIPLTQEDIAWMSENDDFMIPELVKKIPYSVREHLDTLFPQLQMLAFVATRVRAAADAGGDQVVEIMEENDTAAIKEQILKEAVIQASQDVAHLLLCQETWVKNTEKRLDRLTRSAELAEHAQQQLIKVESQLEGFHAANRAKAKKALMGFVETSGRNVLQSSFSQWFGIMVKGRGERALRAKFEEELVAKETFLLQMKEKAIRNVKSVFMRKAREGDENLLGAFFHGWRSEVGGLKREAAEAVALQQLESKLDRFATEKAATAKKVMARMGVNQDESLLVMSFQAWVQGAAELKKEREFMAEVQKAEDQFKEYMEKKKTDAKVILQKMGLANESGLVQAAVKGWSALMIESRKARQLEEEINRADRGFKMLKARQKGCANKLQGRVNEQMRSNLQMRVIAAWQLEAKINHVEKYYSYKMEGKRRQLTSVQTLFKSFAKQLEEGLGNVEEDSSGRTMARRSKAYAGMQRGGGSVSLPDIRARPA